MTYYRFKEGRQGLQYAWIRVPPRHLLPFPILRVIGLSELYGKMQEVPQRESTAFYRARLTPPPSFSGMVTVDYREAYGLYACNGILFNHESPLRGETFVTCKITRAVARVKLGFQDQLIWATWMRGATGGMCATMWRPCGSCCSRKGRMTM